MPLTSYSKLLKIDQRPPARAKPSTSFSTLPTETILHVFKSTQSFSAATKLSSVSRQFNTMWKCNICSISKVILGHSFEAHEEGLALVTALETAANDLHYRETLALIKLPADQDTVLETITRIEHFISNAKVAWLVLNFYEANVITLDKDQPQRLNTKERAQFFKYYYLILLDAIHISTRFAALPSRSPHRKSNLVIWRLVLRTMIIHLQLQEMLSGQSWQLPAEPKSLAIREEPARLRDDALLRLAVKVSVLDSGVLWHQKPWAPFFYLFCPVVQAKESYTPDNAISEQGTSSDGQGMSSNTSS